MYSETIGPFLLIASVDGFRLFHPPSVLLLRAPAATWSAARKWATRLTQGWPAQSISIPSAHTEALSLTICLTTKCNLHCEYCYLHGPDREWPCQDVAVEVQGLQDVRAEISAMLKSSPRKLGITFFGGEPLLEQSTLVNITRIVQEMAVKEGTAVEFGVTTNGTLLDSAFLEWACENRVQVMVSLDSPAGLHNRHRAQGRRNCSYKRILSRLEGFEPNLAVVTTITHETPSFQAALEPLLDHHFRSVSFNLVHTPNQKLRLRGTDARRFVMEWRKSAKWFGQHRRRIGNVSQLHQLVRERRVKSSPCSAGMSSWAVLMDGRRYFCHGCVGNSRFELDAQHQPMSGWLRERWPSAPESAKCAGCWANYMCGGECWMSRWMLGAKEREIRCVLIRGLAELALRTFDPSDAGASGTENHVADLI